MKIALTCSENNLSSPVDPRFGRAKGFFICDSESGESAYYPNVQNVGAVQGAGIQTAQNIINAGADAVVSGHCGPKAFKLLSAAGVKIFSAADCTVSEAVEKIKAGSLPEMSAADVEGHWV